MGSLRAHCTQELFALSGGDSKKAVREGVQRTGLEMKNVITLYLRNEAVGVMRSARRGEFKVREKHEAVEDRGCLHIRTGQEEMSRPR